MGEHEDGWQSTRPDRAEALAALRKAAGLERLLGRLRAGGDGVRPTLRPRPAAAPVQEPAPYAA